jgi:hypothetical protein
VREQFELHFLASPIRRDKVLFARALQVHTGPSAGDVQSKHATDEASRRGWFASLRSFLAPRPGLQWRIAAGLLILIVAGGWFTVDNFRLRRQMSQAQIRRDELQQREQRQQQVDAQQEANSKAEQELAQAHAERKLLDEKPKQQNGRTTPTQPPSLPGQTIAAFILTPGLRGIGQIQTLHIPPGTGRVALQLNLEPNDYQTYRVALIDQFNHQTVWQSGQLRAEAADETKTLKLSFSSGVLKSQTYVMRVRGVSANGQTEVMSDYPFKVVK